MEETPQPPPLLETRSTFTGLWSRMLNVFIAPNEAFEDIRTHPVNHANWIIPLFITIIAGIAYTFVIFSQPAIIQKSRDQVTQRFDKLVAEGKMTQQQADTAIESTQKFITPLFYKLTGSFGAAISSVTMLFLGALILWLLGRFGFKCQQFAYPKALEIVGLTLLITALGQLIGMQLAAYYGDILRTPGPSLFLSKLDPQNKTHLILSSINLITLWNLTIACLGLSKLCNVKFIKPALWLFGIWAVLTFSIILIAGGK